MGTENDTSGADGGQLKGGWGYGDRKRYFWC